MFVGGETAQRQQLKFTLEWVCHGCGATAGCIDRQAVAQNIRRQVNSIQHQNIQFYSTLPVFELSRFDSKVLKLLDREFNRVNFR